MSTYAIVRINILTLAVSQREYTAPTIDKAVAMANIDYRGTMLRVVYTVEGKPMYKEVFNKQG